MKIYLRHPLARGKCKSGIPAAHILSVARKCDMELYHLISRGKIFFFISSEPNNSMTRALPSVMLSGQKT